MKKIIAALFFVVAIFYGGLAYGQNTIDTALMLEVNGVQQYLEIKGDSRTNPVLLFIHGGPGWPATPMLRKYSQALTKDFVLVCWDQRNCGKSKTVHADNLNPELYVEDGQAVTAYLKKTFAVDKIFVVAHSWGTIIGVRLMQQNPDDYAAYIGIGQFVNPRKSEALARVYVQQQAETKKDTTTLYALRQIVFSEKKGYANGFADLMKFNVLARKYFANPAVAVLPDAIQLYDDYKGLDWITPLMTDGKTLFDYMNAVELNFSGVINFSVPVYLFAGRYDYNTSAVLAEAYYNSIVAPQKNFFWFEHSGHSPHWEEPALFHEKLLMIRNAHAGK